jgi:hypothetical protein
MSAITLSVDALTAAPEVIAGLTNVASDVSTDLAAHKTILQTALDAGQAALTTLQNPTVSAVIGTKASAAINDTATTGAQINTDVEPVIPAIENAIAELKAFIEKYL